MEMMVCEGFMVTSETASTGVVGMLDVSLDESVS